jgi:hypothetical protein
MKTGIFAIGATLAIAFGLLWSMKAKASDQDTIAIVTIQWSNFVGETFDYRATSAMGNMVKIELQRKGQTSVIVTNEIDGGMSGVLRLAETASDEMSTNSPQIPTGKEACVLKVQIVSKTLQKSNSIKGDLTPLMSFFNKKPALHDLLEFVSRDLPKKYRLIEKRGPLKQFHN